MNTEIQAKEKNPEENMRVQSTHFGYETVSAAEKTEKVRSVFESVAPKYDIMNDLMSLGAHRLWKKRFIFHVGVTPGMKILDVAGGTGDIAYALHQKLSNTGKVWLTDINHAMLTQAQLSLFDKGIANEIPIVQANAQNLPFHNNYFDRITISFGLRNVTDKFSALQSMLRVLKPGGKLSILEFSKPNKLIAPIYDKYSFKWLPKLGEVIAKDKQSYQYLAESIRMHPSQTELKKMLTGAGFIKADFINLNMGIVAIHWGYKA